MAAIVFFLESVSISFSSSLHLFSELTTCCQITAWRCGFLSLLEGVCALMTNQTASESSHVLGLLCCSFTKSLVPVVLLFLSAVVSPGCTWQQAPVAFSLWETCQFPLTSNTVLIPVSVLYLEFLLHQTTLIPLLLSDISIRVLLHQPFTNLFSKSRLFQTCLLPIHLWQMTVTVNEFILTFLTDLLSIQSIPGATLLFVSKQEKEFCWMEEDVPWFSICSDAVKEFDKKNEPSDDEAGRKHSTTSVKGILAEYEVLHFRCSNFQFYIQIKTFGSARNYWTCQIIRLLLVSRTLYR